MLAAAAVAVALLVWTRQGDGDADLPPDVGVVEYVVDGDTVDIEIGGTEERVRLIGINTPETHVEDGPPDCFGPEATEFTRSLLPQGTEVRLVRDVVGRDDYGRLLAYVYLPAAAGAAPILVNAELVGRGLARTLTIAPNDALAPLFDRLAARAGRHGLGLWGGASC